MARKLYVDIETYSSVDISSSGMYKYIESDDFEILIIAYTFDNELTRVVDLASGEDLPEELEDALLDNTIEKHAHNAAFERLSFKRIGFITPINVWYCTAIKAAYCGLPLSLEAVSKALKLEDRGKLSTGKALIRYFSCPIKPTKANGFITRNYYNDSPTTLEKWEEYKAYCIQDVEAERTIDIILEGYETVDFERVNYLLDQKINDIGITVDVQLAQNAFDMDNIYSESIKNKVKEITQLDNPNSPAQLKNWLSSKLQKEVTTLAKDGIGDLIKEAGPGIVADVLRFRKKLAKSSTKKYLAMLNCLCADGRVHGLFQFYGANRTGRWAGRLVQLQNLPQNHINDLDETREVIRENDYELALMLYDDLSSILSQLIRTAFIAKKDHTFSVADFSAIEARVLSWVASETWREDVFKTPGKIYEASASMMFNVPLEEVTKDSDYRAKGKNAELALGYQGALGAMRRMGGEKMGLSDSEMKEIVRKWRKANPCIVALWYDLEKCAKKAVKYKQKVVSNYKNLEFDCDDLALTIKLPSGRKLFYWDPKFKLNSFGTEAIAYKGVDQVTKQWIHIDTYGGKIVENIVQAISRDVLAYSMQRLDQEGFDINMHVHDETVCEVPNENCEETLKKMCDIMGEDIPWAEGLPLNADGYLTYYYKKD